MEIEQDEKKPHFGKDVGELQQGTGASKATGEPQGRGRASGHLGGEGMTVVRCGPSRDEVAAGAVRHPEKLRVGNPCLRRCVRASTAVAPMEQVTCVPYASEPALPGDLEAL